MNTYILLFRGINVGGNNIMPMKALKALLQDAGCEQVKTYIQSGNVVLNATTETLEKIPQHIAQQFGFTPQVLVLTPQEFTQVYKDNPYPDHEGKTVHFYFCAEAPPLNQEKIDTYIADDEQYQVIGKVFYLHAPSGIGRSKLANNVEACLGCSGTGRNLNTVLKIHQILAEY